MSGVPTKASLSALHRCPWQARQDEAARGQAGQASRSFVPQSTVHPLSFTTPRRLYSIIIALCCLKCAPTIRLHTVLHYSETPLPQHSQSLILASQAPRTPITLSPPLSLQVTDHRPSHVLESRAVVISPKYCTTPWPRAQSSTNLYIPKKVDAAQGLGRLHEHCRCPVRGMAPNC